MVSVLLAHLPVVNVRPLSLTVLNAVPINSSTMELVLPPVLLAIVEVMGPVLLVLLCVLRTTVLEVMVSLAFFHVLQAMKQIVPAMVVIRSVLFRKWSQLMAQPATLLKLQSRCTISHF